MKLVRNAGKPFSLGKARALTCPRCGGVGRAVKAQTVRSLVHASLAAGIGEREYYLCMDDSCEIAYYSAGPEKPFVTEDLKIPLWYKNGASPVYACYCSKVTEEDVRQAVVLGGARAVAVSFVFHPHFSGNSRLPASDLPERSRFLGRPTSNP
jgi:hypothetical protein